MAAALAEGGAEIGLRIAELVDQAMVAGRFLDRVEIRALHVLDDGEFERRSVVRLDNGDRHVVQAGPLGRPPAALAGDDLVGVRALSEGAHHDRLDDAALADRAGEEVEIGLVEGLAWIARVGAQELDRHAPLAAGALDHFRLVARVSDQRGKAAAQARPDCFLSHDDSSTVTRPSAPVRAGGAPKPA